MTNVPNDKCYLYVLRVYVIYAATTLAWLFRALFLNNDKNVSLYAARLCAERSRGWPMSKKKSIFSVWCVSLYVSGVWHSLLDFRVSKTVQSGYHLTIIWQIISGLCEALQFPHLPFKDPSPRPYHDVAVHVLTEIGLIKKRFVIGMV